MHQSIEQIKKYISIFIERKINFTPWIFFSDQEIDLFSNYLSEKYNKRKVFCFARSKASDDYACFVMNGELAGKFIFIHDFASPGWEVGTDSELNCFGEILETMMLDIINIEERSEI